MSAARWPAATWIVFRKELLDALRDRRTLLMVVLSSVAVGPLMLLALSTLIGSLERRAEAREVVVAGIDAGPSLRNFLQRQTYTIKPAPADFEQQLRVSRLTEPVLVVPPDFEAKLAAGQQPVLEIYSSAANQRAQSAVQRLRLMLQGFNTERATLLLAVRGVSPLLLQSVDVEPRDLANPATRAAQFTSMLPFFVLIAVMYGALAAALDTTAGERERGSLEPLLMTPAARSALVTGKWAAVACVGMFIAVLSVLSFLPGQWLLRSETLAAMFRFGAREALLFLGLLLPLAAALAAVLMAVAIRSKSVKEAQANNTFVILAVSMLPLVQVFSMGAERAWFAAVPVLGQMTLMNRVLRGDAIGLHALALACGVCLLLTVASAWYVAQALKSQAVK